MFVPSSKSHQSPHFSIPHALFKVQICTHWNQHWKKIIKMADWGSALVAAMLFVLLTPGLLIQMPGKSRMVEFSTFKTSAESILVHSVIYFALICFFLLALRIHLHVSFWDYFVMWYSNLDPIMEKLIMVDLGFLCFAWTWACALTNNFQFNWMLDLSLNHAIEFFVISL